MVLWIRQLLSTLSNVWHVVCLVISLLDKVMIAHGYLLRE